MISALQNLASVLARDPLTVDEVVAHLGTAAAKAAGNVSVKPNDPAFSAASVVRQGSSDMPAHVSLTLAQPTTLDTLEKSFGMYKKVVPDEGQPRQAIFKLDMAGSRVPLR